MNGQRNVQCRTGNLHIGNVWPGRRLFKHLEANARLFLDHSMCLAHHFTFIFGDGNVEDVGNWLTDVPFLKLVFENQDSETILINVSHSIIRDLH